MLSTSEVINTLYVSNLVVGLEHGLDDPGFLLEAADAVQGGVEFFLHVHSPAYLEKAEKIPAWLRDRPRATHGPFIGVEAASAPGTPEHAHMLEAYRYAFEAAARLGSRHLVFHTHQRVISPEEKAEAQGFCAASIEQLLEMARRYGCKLLIENLGIQRQGVSLFDEGEFLRLLQQYPEADCLIDTGHLHVAGWSAQRVLAALGGRIAGYHFHNNDGVHDSHCRITEGGFPYESFMPLYRKHTPAADITLEYGDDHGIRPGDVAADLRLVQSWL